MSGIKEGLVAIANEVLEDLKKEAETLICESEKNAKDKLEKAKFEANLIYKKILEEANEKIAAERLRMKTMSEVEIRNHLLQVKESLVDEVFEKAEKRLREFVMAKEYHPQLLRFIQEAVKKIPSKSLVVFVNSRDKEWLSNKGRLERLSKKMHVGLFLSSETRDYIGGCKVQSSDGKVGFENTLDARIGQTKQLARGEVAKILFESEK